jgi:phosphohistidine phosphatase
MTIHQKHHLMLMRHGKSDWHSGVVSDFERTLTKRGNTDAARIAHWLGIHRYLPDRIVCSPAVRTLTTALRVTEQLQLNPDLIIPEQDIYEASLQTLLRIIARHAVNSRSLLLIGHNPGLDTLVRYLADAEPEQTASGKLMTTSALAIFDCGDSAISPRQHTLRLHHLVRPRDLD